MNKKKILYIILGIYFFLIFIPVNVWIYLPKKPEVETQAPISTPTMSEVKESSSSPDINSVFGDLISVGGADFTAVYDGLNSDRNRGTFQSFDAATKDITIKAEDGTNVTYTIDDKTVFICMDRDPVVTSDGKSINLWEVYTDFSNKESVSNLIYISTSMSLSDRISYLDAYNLSDPLLFGSKGSRLSWLNIYVADCGSLKSWMSEGN